MRILRSGSIQLVLLASVGFVLTKAYVDSGSIDETAHETGGQEQSVTGQTVQEDVTVVEPGKCADVGLNPDRTGVRTYTPEYCVQAERDARAEFDRTAPLYAYREDCIAQHGEDACKGDMKVVERDGQAQSGYMPVFGGFIVGTAAALAAAHIVNTMQGTAVGRVPRPIPVYTSLSEQCRTNRNAPGCPTTGGGGGSGGSGGRSGGGRASYSYGYGSYTVAESGTSGRTTATVTKTASGRFAPTTSARPSFSGSAARSGSATVGTTARGGFGGSAGGHAGGGGHGGGGT